MPDARTLRQKLEAMANQTASPQEAEVARAMLANLPETRGGNETRRVLTREEILAAPSHTPTIRRGIAVRFPTGRWVHMFEDEANWELIEAYQMPFRYEGSSAIITPKPGVTPNKRPTLAK